MHPFGRQHLYQARLADHKRTQAALTQYSNSTVQVHSLCSSCAADDMGFFQKLLDFLGLSGQKVCYVRHQDTLCITINSSSN